MKEECSRYINFDINELIRILYRFIFLLVILPGMLTRKAHTRNIDGIIFSSSERIVKAHNKYIP